MTKAQLKNSLKTMAGQMRGINTNIEDSDEAWANQLADIIDTYVNAKKITLPPGSIVVQGTATQQSNLSPIEINNALS